MSAKSRFMLGLVIASLLGAAQGYAFAVSLGWYGLSLMVLAGWFIGWGCDDFFNRSRN